MAHQLDELFYHRIQRKVRKDGTISYEGKLFEVPYSLSQKTVTVVIEPQQKQALYIEDEEGKRIGEVTPLDLQKNRNYKRTRSENNPVPIPSKAPSSSLNELALKQQEARLSISPTPTPTPTETETSKTHTDKQQEK